LRSSQPGQNKISPFQVTREVKTDSSGEAYEA
jgi:hypothetical protein